MHARVLALAGCLLVASPAAGYHEEGQDWIDGTAYTLRGGELSLGPRLFAFGLLDEVFFGTSPVLWIAGPFFGTVVPNAEVKARDWIHGPLAASVSASFMYVDATSLLDSLLPEQGVKAAHLLSLTATAAASMRLEPALVASLELLYSELNLGGGTTEASFEGTAVLDSLRLGGLLEWRLTRVFAARFSGQTLLYREPPTVEVAFEATPDTTVDSELHVGRTPPIGAWQLLASIALSGEHLNFLLGAGYGWQWLPVGGLVLTDPGVVFDLDFFVRF